jgi:DNA processing protein
LHSTEFEAWFRLLETPGVGRDTARRLLSALGCAESVLQAPLATLRNLVGPGVADALHDTPPNWANRLRAAQDWLGGGEERHVLSLGEAAYPPLLLQTADPPVLLYVWGQTQALVKRGVAIVGSRHATAQGNDNARAFAAALSQQGLAVYSGLALGIDAAAHEGALTGAGGTVAVVGRGLDKVYPPRNEQLAQRIAQQGALVSEYAPGTPALPDHFPQRNRIIAGLSLGTVVVEAALRSGSLITARLALEAGREVFAVPGSIHAPQSKGCHQLIKQGAKLVEAAQDILEELGHVERHVFAVQQVLDLNDESASSSPNHVTSPATSPVLQALGHDPVSLDALQARTGWSTPDLLAALLDLELSNEVARLPGGLYQRRTVA